jgi:hypothetical protein
VIGLFEPGSFVEGWEIDYEDDDEEYDYDTRPSPWFALSSDWGCPDDFAVQTTVDTFGASV